MSITNRRSGLLRLILYGLLAVASVANAEPVYTYVGSWAPYSPDAPQWDGFAPNGPLAYTGQEAAALLFGGSPSDYAISTIDSNPANINNMAWYDVIGVEGHQFAENYSNKYLGMYYGPSSGYQCCGDDYVNSNAASAYVRDNSVMGMNYAFRLSTANVPEPTAYAVFGVAAGTVVLMRRRRTARS